MSQSPLWLYKDVNKLQRKKIFNNDHLKLRFLIPIATGSHVILNKYYYYYSFTTIGYVLKGTGIARLEN